VDKKRPARLEAGPANQRLRGTLRRIRVQMRPGGLDTLDLLDLDLHGFSHRVGALVRFGGAVAQPTHASYSLRSSDGSHAYDDREVKKKTRLHGLAHMASANICQFPL
jgi:hypothetical protein